MTVIEEPLQDFSLSRPLGHGEQKTAYTGFFEVGAQGQIGVLVWDAENRLTSMTALTTIPDAAKKKLEFTYDYMGRRISKKTYTWDAGTSSYTLLATRLFVYDAWNLVAELNANGTALRTYTWGQDLSGSMQGAGGVGGLLAINNTSDASTHFVTMDGNGNVMALLNADTGVVSAEYEYGPFGEPIKATGPMAKANPFTFSTKYTDQESGLLYYGYRYLNASTGRWLSRDPIEEWGGINLYGICSNNPVCCIDSFGAKLDNYTTPYNSVSWSIVQKGDLGNTEVGWPLSIATVDGKKIKVKGTLSIRLFHAPGIDPKLKIGADGRTVFDHERFHFDIDVKWWNKLVPIANGYEELKWCEDKCAELAAKLVNSMNQYLHASQSVENAIFDQNAYGGGADVTKEQAQESGAVNGPFDPVAGAWARRQMADRYYRYAKQNYENSRRNYNDSKCASSLK